MSKPLPVGVAQQVILTALGLEASSFDHAEQRFATLGIVVKPVRQGRTSVPQVRIKDRHDGGFTRDGDGESWRAYGDLSPAQVAALAPYMATKTK